jgi:hypothetical protein
VNRDHDERMPDPTAEEQDLLDVTDWIRALTWPAFILLGLVAIELTSDPMLGTMLACSKLAWGDVRTAFWVRRIDPSPGRGKSLFWFLLVCGMCRVMLWSLVIAVGLIFVTAVAVVVVLPQFGEGGRALAKMLDDDRLGTTLVKIAVFGMASLGPVLALTAMACFTARRHQIRVWIDGSLERACHHRVWPPRCDGRRNQLDSTMLVVTAALVFATIQGVVLSLTILPRPYGTVVAIGLAVTVPVISWFVGGSVVAGSAAECWWDCLPAPSSPVADPGSDDL